MRGQAVGQGNASAGGIVASLTAGALMFGIIMYAESSPKQKERYKQAVKHPGAFKALKGEESKIKRRDCLSMLYGIKEEAAISGASIEDYLYRNPEILRNTYGNPFMEDCFPHKDVKHLLKDMQKEGIL